MREIKFKAWEPSGKMHGVGICDCCFSQDDVAHIWSIHGVDDDCTEEDKAIPLQFTGLKDSKGVEIFEGDIVKIRDNLGDRHIGSVNMIDGCWSTLGADDAREYLKCHVVNHAIEVIGNIFENPEFLKGE